MAARVEARGDGAPLGTPALLATRFHSATHAAEPAERGAHPEVRDDLQLLPWLALGPNFLRESGEHRSLIDDALKIARERAAVGALPLVLALVARDEATSDRWPVAEAGGHSASLCRSAAKEAAWRISAV